jgi:predicted  nucleic acid-binding Zn-ribbon protein
MGAVTVGLERVRCLGCGVVYAKPTGVGTVTANPGCPECGYVGWLLESSPFNRAALQLRSAGHHPRHRAD